MTYNVFSGTLNPTHFTSLHDLSTDGGTYPKILFCKLLAVTRETKVTLSCCTKPKKHSDIRMWD